MSWEVYFKEVFRDIGIDPNSSFIQNITGNNAYPGMLAEDHLGSDFLDYYNHENLTLNFPNLTFIVKDMNFFENMGTALDIQYNERDIGIKLTSYSLDITLCQLNLG